MILLRATPIACLGSYQLTVFVRFRSIPGHGTSTSRQTLTSSLRPSWLSRASGNGDIRSSDRHHHHHHHGIDTLGLSVGVRSGKGCSTLQCSWRLLAIALLLTCGLLAAALAYFTGKRRHQPTLYSPILITAIDFVISELDWSAIFGRQLYRYRGRASDAAPGGRTERENDQGLATPATGSEFVGGQRRGRRIDGPTIATD